MDRRKFLFSSGAAAVSVLVGSDAFSQIRARQRIEIGTAGDGEAYLQILPNEGEKYADIDGNELSIEIEKLRRDSETTFSDLLEVRNQGTDPVGLYIENTTNSTADGAVDFKSGGDSIVGEDRAVELPVGESKNVSVAVDLLSHNESDLPEDGTLDVIFVADSEIVDSGSSGTDDGDGGSSGDDGDQDTGATDTLSVAAPDTVEVGGSNTVDFTATVADTGTGGGEATVSLTVEGNQETEKTVDVPSDGETEATFSVGTVYDDVHGDGYPYDDRHGSLRLDGTDWEVSADLNGTAQSENGSTDVQDAPIEFYEPDNEYICAVCGMMTKMYDSWNAQATHDDGTRMEFCSTGCLVSYYVDPQGGTRAVDVPDSPINGVWVVNFPDRPVTGPELIDGDKAYFVLDYDVANRFTTPMSGSPPAFETEQDAVDYVNSYDNVDESDIVSIEDWDDAAANEYRPNFHS
ncbi:nitrous oxide reductase accessory protein NosL [Halorutilales archaeon Cl-col2-1]